MQTTFAAFGKRSLRALTKQKAVIAILAMLILMLFFKTNFYTSYNLLNVLKDAAVNARIRAAFDAAFGPGAGERVRLACRKTAGQPVVIGLTIGLAAGEGTLPVLIGGAVPIKSRCTEGIAAVAGAR